MGFFNFIKIKKLKKKFGEILGTILDFVKNIYEIWKKF